MEIQDDAESRDNVVSPDKDRNEDHIVHYFFHGLNHQENFQYRVAGELMSVTDDAAQTCRHGIGAVFRSECIAYIRA